MSTIIEIMMVLGSLIVLGFKMAAVTVVSHTDKITQYSGAAVGFAKDKLLECNARGAAYLAKKAAERTAK